MQYEASTPDEYLSMLEADWRAERLLAIRDMLFAEVPGIEEGIGYKMLQYRVAGEVFAHLNVQKGYVGVYLGDLERIDPDGIIRAGANCGKGCLRVRKRDSLEVSRALIARKAAGKPREPSPEAV